MANEVQIFEMIGGRGESESPPVNFVAKQTLSIGGAISAAFNRSTTEVEVISTTGCVIEFGSAPDGLGSFYPIAAGHPRRFSVVAGQKVIAVSGTATAPAVSIAAGGASGTEYTEDAASAADPVGPMFMARRRDTLVTNEVSATGDNIALNATNKGQLHVSNADQLPASLGPKTPALSLAVTQSGYQYETVAASQSNQAMGATGATGDYLSHVLIQPTTTVPGTVTILDNAVTVFTFTTCTVADLRPIVVPVGLFSVSGAWKITTGTNVTATGVGNFT